MNEQVTRQILWNIPAPFIVLMYGLLALFMAGCVYAFMKWYRLVTLGVSENRLDRPFERLLLSLRDSFGQGNVIRETWGWMHYAFYVAFVGLFIGTTIVLINSDLRDLLNLFGVDFYFYYGDFYLYFKARDGHLLPAADPRRVDGRYAPLGSANPPCSTSRPPTRCVTTSRTGSATGSQ